MEGGYDKDVIDGQECKRKTTHHRSQFNVNADEIVVSVLPGKKHKN